MDFSKNVCYNECIKVKRRKRVYSIYLYPILSFILPVVFWLVKREYTWVSIPVAVIIEVFFYWNSFLNEGTRQSMIMITFIQIVVMLIVISLIKYSEKKLKYNIKHKHRSKR